MPNHHLHYPTSNNRNKKEQDTSSLTSDDVARKKIKNSLRFFRLLIKKRVTPISALQILKNKRKFVNDGKTFIGKLPGVHIGDEFHRFEELNVVGLHRQTFNGIQSIDHAIHKGKLIAVSIVCSSSFHHDDEIDDYERVLVYTGEEGKENLALKNSFDVKNPIRVIIRFNFKKNHNRRRRRGSGCGEMYYYYGLYKVDKFEIGKLGYKFSLVKLHLVFDEDISKGKEAVHVNVVNDVDYERIPFFRYINRMVYPNWCNPVKGGRDLVGCNCVGECSDSVKCCCAVKNEGKFGYDENKGIMRMIEKDVIYECGRNCKCLKSCRNRVSQYGIKFKLEIFKTEKKGWGVRSHNRIPSGSFVCEYLGEIIGDEEAEEIDRDEYLFSISKNRNSNVYGNGNYTIDAAKCGNVARFINHSCSPNLFCQRVLYDHDDGRISHMMLFAAKDIPIMQELTLNYNYEIDQVIDSNGNVKKKSCYCGAFGCSGRLY